MSVKISSGTVNNKTDIVRSVGLILFPHRSYSKYPLSKSYDTTVAEK